MPFWSENENRFCPFWSGIGYGLRRNYGCVSMRSSFQFQINEKESLIYEFEMDSLIEINFFTVLISAMMT